MKKLLIGLCVFLGMLLPSACDWSDCGPISDAMDSLNDGLTHLYDLRDHGDTSVQEEIDRYTAYAETLQQNWQILCQTNGG